MSTVFLTRLKAPFAFPSPYQIHLMTGDIAGEQVSRRKCLHRFDDAGINTEMWLQTEAPPNLDKSPWKAETHALDLSGINAGQQMGFRVRLSPSVCVKGRRQDMVGYVKQTLPPHMQSCSAARPEAVKQWFAKRADSLGFTVNDFEIEGHRWQKIDKPGAAKPIEFNELDVAGIMTVTDTAKLINAVKNGIGRERAFGCGMMFLYVVTAA